MDDGMGARRFTAVLLAAVVAVMLLRSPMPIVGLPASVHWQSVPTPLGRRLVASNGPAAITGDFVAVGGHPTAPPAQPIAAGVRPAGQVGMQPFLGRHGLPKAAPIADWQAHINPDARFATIGSAWCFQDSRCGNGQDGGQHWGVDVLGHIDGDGRESGEGVAVAAPFGGRFQSCQDNGDEGAYVGKWIVYIDDRGAEILMNHFRDLGDWCGKPVNTRIEAGQILGRMRGDANHIHFQVRLNGQLLDFEQYWADY